MVSFSILGEEQIRDVVGIQLKVLAERLKLKNMELVYDERTLDFLSKKGFDPLYGARPLKRVIQSEILNPLSKLIIKGDIEEGARIRLEANDLNIGILSDSKEV